MYFEEILTVIFVDKKAFFISLNESSCQGLFKTVLIFEKFELLQKLA